MTRDHEYKDPTNPDTLVSSTEHQKCMAVHSMRTDICLHCQVAKKAKKEMLPSTKLYSERSRAPDASHEVTREHEYKDATDPDTLVPPEERQKAYKVPSSYLAEHAICRLPAGEQCISFDTLITSRHQ